MTQNLPAIAATVPRNTDCITLNLRRVSNGYELSINRGSHMGERNLTSLVAETDKEVGDIAQTIAHTLTYNL